MGIVGRDAAMLSALETVLQYREGRGPFNFSALPADERECAAFDAWQEVEAKIRKAISHARDSGSLPQGEKP